MQLTALRQAFLRSFISDFFQLPDATNAFVSYPLPSQCLICQQADKMIKKVTEKAAASAAAADANTAVQEPEAMDSSADGAKADATAAEASATTAEATATTDAPAMDTSKDSSASAAAPTSTARTIEAVMTRVNRETQQAPASVVVRRFTRLPSHLSPQTQVLSENVYWASSDWFVFQTLHQVHYVTMRLEH